MWENEQISPEDLAGLAVADQIDVICDRFEKAWWGGNPPEFTDYLGYVDARHRRQLFVELLLVDWELRSHDPQGSDWGHYRAHYPEFGAQIEEAWLKLRGDVPGTDVERHERIGHFDLLKKLGSGAGGTVWKAIDTRLQRTVAIKIPHTRHLSETSLNRFLLEGRAAANLNHPGIVPIHEVGRDGDAVYSVSAYIDGQNLREWLATNHPTPREAAVLIVALANAVHHAHDRGVIHRDLKPSNIILDATRSPHITDFGLAKYADDKVDMTFDGELVGTPAYMSPEQARGQSAAVDRRTDVYSLGVILYELLTGRRPFDGEQAVVVHQVIYDEPVRPRVLQKSIPRDLETICLKALAKSPDDRYWSAQELAVDLNRFLDARPILARRPNVFERSWWMVRRHPALAAAVVLACLLFGALAFAGRLAVEKRALLGLQTVVVSTEPEGAKVVIVPLDNFSGEPVPEKAYRPRRLTPVKQDLPAGDYFIVAVLPDGRFHEVYRHVPVAGAQELPLFGSRHLSWKILDNGEVVLPAVKIPAASSADGMALVDDPAASQTFYMDCHEFTVAEYRELFDQLPLDKQWVHVPDDYAATVRFDWAAGIAEKLGKRLPTNLEYEAAARRRVQNSSESEGTQLEKDVPLGPAGTPSNDRTDTVPPIIGLYSNVAEWTVTRSLQVRVRNKEHRSVLDADDRIVRGGDWDVIHGTASSFAARPTPGIPAVVERKQLQPGLGFRCVRSVTPQYINP